MNPPHGSPEGDPDQKPGQYEIRVTGHLDARWSTWLDGLCLVRESDGTTRIYGAVADQAALHGLLRKIRDLGLPLISVNRVTPAQEAHHVQQEGEHPHA